MTKFDRTFPECWMDMLTNLAKKSGWWRDLLDYRFEGADGEKHWLVLAVRDGYLNAYVEGQSILKIKFNKAVKPSCLRGKIHHKYLGGAVGQKYKIFDGVNVDGNPYLPEKSLGEWVERAQKFAKLDSGRGEFSEKQGVAVIAGSNSHVIDLEMALPGLVAPRIDIVALERAGSSINIVFYEAKLFGNSALRARDVKPKVLDQLDKYETWLTSENRTGEVVEAYREACRLLIKLRSMQDVLVDALIEEASMANSLLVVDPKPRLIIFGAQTSKGWPPHESVLHRAGIIDSRLIIRDHPKDVELPKARVMNPAR